MVFFIKMQFYSTIKILVIAQILLGLFSLFLVLFWINSRATSVNDAGLGHNTEKRMDSHKQGKVFYSSLTKILKAHHDSNKKKKYYWLGASQLYAINDFKYGDRAAPYIVFDNLDRIGSRLYTISYPNAYPAEHLIIATHILTNTKIDGLVIGAVYDDMRERNVRYEIANAVKNINTRGVLNKSKIGKKLVADSDAALRSKEFLSENKITNLNLMKRSENAIIRLLETSFKAETIRSEGRGLITLQIIRLRQFIEGLRARYTRDISNYRYPIPNNQYQYNLNAWEELLKLAYIKETPVLVYIAPRPTDFFPYDPIKYEEYKKSIFKLTQYYGATYINLENLILSKYFGHVDTNFGFLVRDPFHIQGVGHSLLAREITKEIKKLEGNSIIIK